MSRRFLADIIGEDYINWQPGQSILIATMTGSGKTRFILETLLPYAKAQGKHIVYYCNRKFLNMQVQASARRKIYDELGADKEGLAPYLHIRTYQYIEHKKDFPNVVEVDEEGNEYRILESQILYYVFDEAMYPVQDSSFNCSAQYWYEKRNELKRSNAVTVFMTATPEQLYLYRKTCDGGLEEIFQRFIAEYSVSENINYKHWSYYLYHPEAEQPALKAYLGDPYAKLFDWVEDAYRRDAHWVDYCYAEERSLSECYDYVDTYYFDEIDSLAHLIAKSVKEAQRKTVDNGDEEEKDRKPVEDAWLVFVRTIEDARSLRLALKTLDCPSVVITSKFTKHYDGKPTKRKSSTKAIFNMLANDEYLGVHVLISTSVLDCGITLHAKNVTNLVVCQPNKTSFQQMLGRIRVAEGERINLYIQAYTPKQVRAFKQKIVDDFLFLVHFMWINKLSPKRDFMQWREPNMFAQNDHENYMHFLPAETRKRLILQLENDKNRWRFLLEKERRSRRNYDLQSVENLSVNELAVIHYLGQIYYYSVQLHKNKDDPYYFLKDQLSWIGKTYDPERWIDYHSSRKILYGFLADKSTKFVKNRPVDSSRAMDNVTQSEFREKCFEYLNIVRVPPDSFLQAKKRHTIGSNNYPGKSKLNEIFTDMDIPFQIRSLQNKGYIMDETTREWVVDSKTGKPKVDNKSYWYVCPADVEKEQMKLEEKREDKLNRREKRKEEKTREKEQKPTAEKVVNPDNPAGVFIQNYPKKKMVNQIETIAQESSRKEKPSLKIQLMRGDKTWNPGE